MLTFVPCAFTFSSLQIQHVYWLYNFIHIKVQSTDAEREELQVETVTHEPSKGLSTTMSVSRKHWLEHRKVLEEKMRQKRLEQYEMRLKEEGTCPKSTNENTGVRCSIWIVMLFVLRLLYSFLMF